MVCFSVSAVSVAKRGVGYRYGVVSTWYVGCARRGLRLYCSVEVGAVGTKRGVGVGCLVVKTKKANNIAKCCVGGTNGSMALVTENRRLGGVRGRNLALRGV